MSAAFILRRTGLLLTVRPALLEILNRFARLAVARAFDSRPFLVGAADPGLADQRSGFLDPGAVFTCPYPPRFLNLPNDLNPPNYEMLSEKQP